MDLGGPPERSEVTFWRPDPKLARFVSGYHRYAIGGAPGARVQDVFYPAWTNLRFTFDAEGPWSVRIRRRPFDRVPENALFGPTSHAGYVEAPRGWMVGAGITPAGWARLFGGDASAIADRIVPLNTVVGDADALRQAVAAADTPNAAFDRWLLDRLAARLPADPAVDTIFEQINDPAVVEIVTLAARTGLSPRALLRVTRNNFGFPPKLLLRRARFLRALIAASASDRGGWAEAARAAGYWDGSHFLRDCHLFLDRKLSDFVAMEKPLNRLSTTARNAALGAPMQSLHAPSASPSSLP